MNTARLFVLVLVSSICGPLLATESEKNTHSQVEWFEPEEYRDIKEPDSYSRSSYQAYVFNQFEDYFELAAKKYLPADQRLKVKVTDLDLAGWVRPFGRSNMFMRVIENGFIPRIKFSYQVLNKQNVEITSGEADLKNMAMTNSIILPPSLDDFKYEFYMLQSWFKDTFVQKD